MATRPDFTEAEWKAMQKGVTGAGMLVSVTDLDFTDTFAEMGVLAQYLDQQRAASGSELVRDLAGAHVSGYGLLDSQQEAGVGERSPRFAPRPRCWRRRLPTR